MSLDAIVVIDRTKVTLEREEKIREIVREVVTKYVNKSLTSSMEMTALETAVPAEEKQIFEDELRLVLARINGQGSPYG